MPVAPPIGVMPGASFVETSMKVERGGTVLAFTDGLVERREESLDSGLSRLRSAAGGSVERLLGRLLLDLTPEGSDDDIAILGVQWQPSMTA